MLKVRRRFALTMGAVALVCVVSLSGVAAAAGGGPTLVAPKKGARVTPGHIRLVVRDTAVPRGFSVFVQVSPTHKLNRFGHLADCNNVSKRCDFLELKRWKGHAGEWIYKTNPGVSFPGYWATTGGRYYWQAMHVNCFTTEKDRCHVTSKIGTFRVR